MSSGTDVGASERLATVSSSLSTRQRSRGYVPLLRPLPRQCLLARTTMLSLRRPKSARTTCRGRCAPCVRMAHCTRPSWRWATGAQRPTRSMRRSMSDNMSTSLLFFPSIRSPAELCGAARRTTWVRCDASPTPRRVVQHAAPLLQPDQLGADAKMCRVGSAAAATAGRQR